MGIWWIGKKNSINKIAICSAKYKKCVFDFMIQSNYQRLKIAMVQLAEAQIERVESRKRIEKTV